MTNTIAVRQRPLPKALQDSAASAGMEPREYLVHILSVARSNEDAASAIGVSRKTLWRWCRRLSITVEVA